MEEIRKKPGCLNGCGICKIYIACLKNFIYFLPAAAFIMNDRTDIPERRR